jgi:methyltransferase (TIGR00027 family)
MVVACARGASDLDPLAELLVPRPAAVALRAARALAGGGERRARAMSVLSLGLLDHVALRTRAIDEVVAAEASSGASQVVVLGAGLDARAWRMEGLAHAVVFEVDHPSTQAFKRARLERAKGEAHADVRFVGVDFERDDVAERLDASGHRVDVRTVWIWEGVTMYLAREAVTATLDVAARRSAPGSVLAMTYATADYASRLTALRPLVGPAFRVLGEPLRGLLSPADAQALVTSRGFAVEDDQRCADLARRFGRPEPWIAIEERLMVARRT